jgi:hypothetical protein
LLKHHKPNETKSTGVKSMKKKHPLLWDWQLYNHY